MSKPVIKIENLSKVYRLGEVGTGTLAHDLNRFWQMNVLGKEDPYAKIGQVNDRTQRAQKGEHISALRDINLEVQQGEVLGIIGKNGAGKSTLLKILSRVTSPTTGSIKVKGRLASLLEVGTGFHPEMTGRENIYMNGTIMGMRKWEIDRKLDEIVEFAGVAKYLDTPTKRYSSGMTVRLGFAIAAHLEPEILVVDEVLAVGDAEFQKKAIGKMQDVSTNDGRTVLFVSHNMASVRNLCQNGIILEQGELIFKDQIESAVNKYLVTNKNDEHNLSLKERKDRKGTGEARIINISITTENKDYIATGDNIVFNFKIDHFIQGLECTFTIYDINETRIAVTNSTEFSVADKTLRNGKKELNCKINNLNLMPGEYYINTALTVNNSYIDHVEKALQFKVEDGILNQRTIKHASNHGIIALDHQWVKNL